MHPTRIYARVGLIPSRMISKNTEGTYSNMSLEEKESLYEEIYKPGIIDDMYGLGFMPMMADYSLLPHVALFLQFEIFKESMGIAATLSWRMMPSRTCWMVSFGPRRS
jgi:hypothetical protein